MDGQVAAIDVPERKKLQLDSQFTPESVQPVIAELKQAEEGQFFELHMRHNGGGCVDQLFELIDVLAATKADVNITFGRYAMSAAATLWLWFRLRPTPLVRSLTPLKPSVLMYHRPRRQYGDSYICFAEGFKDDDPIRESLMEKVVRFDKLFDQMLERAGWRKEAPNQIVIDGVQYQHGLQFLRDAYYMNQDCILPI